MKTGTAVLILVLGFGTLAGAAAQQQPPAGPLPPSNATWRAIVVDAGAQTLLLLDAATTEPAPVDQVVPGYVFRPRDPSRLVVFGSQADGTTATVFSPPPPRFVGPVSLGGDCGVPSSPGVLKDWFFRSRLVESADGRRMVLLCSGMLVSLDLQSGAVAKQPVPARTRLYSGGDGRVLAVSEEWSSGPLTTLRYFDENTLAETRTVSLAAPLIVSRVSADGRFAYADNMDRNKAKQTAREVRILRADTGEVLETVTLQEAASWFIGDRGLPAMIEDRRFKEPGLGRLLVLDEGRVIARLPMHNYVHQLSVDWDRGRMYLLDGRSLAVYTWPGLQLEKQVAVGRMLDWGGQPSDMPFMSLSPGETRALVVSGSRAVAVDLVAGTALPEARLGSSFARALKVAGYVAILPLLMANRGPLWSTDRSALARSPLYPVPVAFSEDGRTAMLPAPNGQLTTIDMTTGRALRHVPGGDGAIAFAGAPLVITADKQSSWVLNVATGEVIARFAVPAADADAPMSASVSPDGRLVLIGRGTAVHLLDAATGRAVQDWTGFRRIGAVRFLPDVPTS